MGEQAQYPNEVLNQVIPKFRHDIRAEVFEQDSVKYVALIDPFGYSKEPVVLTLPFFYLIENLNGMVTFKDLLNSIKTEAEEEPDLTPVFESIKKLDECYFLDTPIYHEHVQKAEEEYLKSPVRPAICSGNSYSNQKEILNLELDDILDSFGRDGIAANASAIIVPHIDFRSCREARETYSAGYKALQQTDADLFVIFGTSHNVSSDYFMLTEKDYETPLGAINTDKELITELKNSLNGNLKIDDLAHKFEHSVELQLVLIQKAYENKRYKVLPVLVGSLFEFIPSKLKPSENERINEFSTKLMDCIKKLGRKPVFIASVDFAHIGRKFGDSFDAEGELKRLHFEDMELVEALSAGNYELFFRLIANAGDKNKICGLSPIYTMLNIIKPKKGKFLNYGQWNEIETRSAVSFASLAYYAD